MLLDKVMPFRGYVLLLIAAPRRPEGLVAGGPTAQARTGSEAVVQLIGGTHHVFR